MEEKITKKLHGHAERIERMQMTLKELYGNDQKHEERIERIIKYVLEHDDRIRWLEENTATKKDFDQVLSALDQMIRKQDIMNQEITMINHALRRHEDKLETHDQEIATIKSAIHI